MKNAHRDNPCTAFKPGWRCQKSMQKLRLILSITLLTHSRSSTLAVHTHGCSPEQHLVTALPSNFLGAFGMSVRMLREMQAFLFPKKKPRNAAIYVASGAATIAEETIEAGQMAILAKDTDIPVSVRAGTRFMLAGGQKMDGPRLIDWNFVATDKDRLEQAKTDWQTSAKKGWQDTPFTLPYGEEDYIPLPGT